MGSNKSINVVSSTVAIGLLDCPIKIFKTYIPPKNVREYTEGDVDDWLMAAKEKRKQLEFTDLFN